MYHSMMDPPHPYVTAAPAARKMPNGTNFFVLYDIGPKIREPRRAPKKIVSSTPDIPRKDPTMDIILTIHES